jgi:hypothetical protein
MRHVALATYVSKSLNTLPCAHLSLIGAALTALASFAFCRDAPPKAQPPAGRMTAKRPSTPRTILWTGLLLVSAFSLQVVVDKSSQFVARISVPIHPSVEPAFLGEIEHADQTSASRVGSTPSPSMDGWYECLQDTSSRFVEQLRADLDDPGRNRTIAIVDVPLHPNLGDIFIILGEIRALVKLGMLFLWCMMAQVAEMFRALLRTATLSPRATIFEATVATVMCSK